MGIKADYIKKVMDDNPIIGNELLRLNINHIMEEMNIKPEDIVKTSKKEKRKNK